MYEESFPEAWRLRYGEEPAFGFPDLAPFLRHRSVRKYSDKPVSEELMSALIAAAQSAATSSTLQLWTVVSVQNPETRETIAQMADNYNHIRQAKWFLCFLADHYRLKEAAKAVGEGAEGLPYTEFFTMAVIDAALAAERLVCAAESIGLGICYIGALRNNAPGIKEVLGLPEGTFGVFGLCIGWPEEPLTAEIKPRLSQGVIWHRERYNGHVDVSEYDERMRAFYESQKMKGEVTWSMRSGRRVDEHHMTGREILFDWLRSQGFLKK
ncbi:MAG TPA: nitroreductase family protein [Fimbriimonadaceae bacterium]|nr:nitroreductase family protein [Fimbriimonadaceae bacterium]